MLCAFYYICALKQTILMMKTLILVRHTKAVKPLVNIEDIDRSLIEKNLEDAHLMARWLKKNKHFPDLILTSPAVRAYSTALFFARTLNYPLNNIMIDKSLYECGVEGYLDVISSVKNVYHTVMLFGHNPDITYTASKLCENFHEDIPTSGIVGIDINIKSWEEINHTKGTLKFYEYPK